MVVFHNFAMCREWKYLEKSAFMGYLPCTPPFKAQGFMQMRRWKDCKNKGVWQLQGNRASRHIRDDAQMNSCWQGQLCTRPARTQADNIPTQKSESRHSAPPLDKKLFVADSFWKRGKSIFLAGISLSVSHMFQNWQKTQYLSNQNWTALVWFQFRDLFSRIKR